jgi:hypothetical protein
VWGAQNTPYYSHTFADIPVPAPPPLLFYSMLCIFILFYCIFSFYILCLGLPGRGPAVRHVEEDRDEEQSADNRRSGEQEGGVHPRICQIYAPGKSIELSVHFRICQIYVPGNRYRFIGPPQNQPKFRFWKKYQIIGPPPDLSNLRSWKKYRINGPPSELPNLSSWENYRLISVSLDLPNFCSWEKY